MQQAEFAALIDRLQGSESQTDIRNRLILELMFYNKLTKEEIATIFQITPRRVEQIIKEVTGGMTSREVTDNQRQKVRLKELCDNLKEGIDGL